MGIKISPADKAFSDCIHLAFDHTCARCGRVGRVECSHIHSRKHRTIRWCADNAIAKCHTCHRWWHENPTEAGLWFVEKYGQGREDILIEKKNTKLKISKIEEKEIAKHYREQLKVLTERRSNGETGILDFVSYQ
jgi:hypothetical protein